MSIDSRPEKPESFNRTEVVTQPSAKPEEPAPAGARTRLGQLGAAGALGAVAVLITLVFWPGAIDADTAAELQDVVSGHYNDWHVPILEMLWHIPYRIGLHSPGWVLFVGVYTLLVGFYLVLRVRLSRLWASVFAVICCVFPPVLTMAIHINVDTWFTASILCAFGFVARMTRTSGRARTWSMVGAVWFAAIASAALHNAIPAIVVLFVAMAAIVFPKYSRRKIILFGLGVLGALGVFLVEFGVQAVVGTRSSHPVQATYIYDLAQLSKEEHRVLLPPEVDPGQSLAAIESGVDVHGSYNLLFSKDAAVHPFPVEGHAFTVLQKAWEHNVLHHPRGWLRERLRVGQWMLSIGHPSFSLYYPPYPGYPVGFPTLYRWGHNYLNTTAYGFDYPYGDFLYDGWIYALISIAGAVVLWRRSKAERVISGFAIGMLLFTLVLTFVGPGELYRYTYPVVATGTVVLILLLAPLASRLRARIRRGQPAVTEVGAADPAAVGPGFRD